MPFTFAHPAIVLPLTRLPKRWYSFTGLVVGSVVPDFEYFLRMKVESIYSHTLPGIFYFDLPLGLLFCFVFHIVVRDTLFDNLPTAWSKHLIAFKSFDWMSSFKHNWLTVVLSVIIGTLSHIVWDAFTHASGYFVHMIPILNSVLSVASFKIPLYKILQHLSSFLGIITIILFIAALPVQPDQNRVVYPDYWRWVGAIIFITVSLRLLTEPFHKVYGTMIIATLSGFLLAIVIIPIAGRYILPYFLKR